MYYGNHLFAMRTFFALASALRCLDHPWTAPPGRASTGPDTRPGRASTGPGRRRRVGPRLARDGAAWPGLELCRAAAGARLRWRSRGPGTVQAGDRGKGSGTRRRPSERARADRCGRADERAGANLLDQSVCQNLSLRMSRMILSESLSIQVGRPSALARSIAALILC